jgi:muconate cycloisomerase
LASKLNPSTQRKLQKLFSSKPRSDHQLNISPTHQNLPKFSNLLRISYRVVGGMNGLKITRVEIIPVVVPFKQLMDTYNAKIVDEERGLYPVGRMPIQIIKLHTDEGLVGLGEAYRGLPEWAIERSASMLIGKDLFEMNLQKPITTMAADLSDIGVDAPFNIALYNLVGKALKVPVYRLLGGAYRTDVPVSAWSPYLPPERTAAIAEKARDMGYTSFKIKGRPRTVVEVVDAISKVDPDMDIVIDPMHAFKYLSTAVKLARRLERYNIICIEDPIPKDNLNLYRILREKTDIPIAIHARNNTELIQAIKHDACDIINTVSGNMHDFMKSAGTAELAGIPVWHGSGADLGILNMSYVHVCAVTRNCILPNDISGEFCRVDDMIVDPIEIKNSFANVPNKPGLGVELDEEAIKKYKSTEKYIGPRI